MIDSRLLKLKYFLEQRDYHFLLIELSEYFEVSERQMGRLLKKWQEDNLIEYQSASGRGNKASIKLIKDVESLILKDIINRVPDLSVEELQTILELPFEEKSIHVLQQTVNNVVLNVKEEQVVIPYTNLPQTLNPSHISTIEEAQVVYQIFETLYRLTVDGKIQRNLISYDEWIDNELHLYLKKEVSFSNGDMLVAGDVKTVLDNLRTDSLYTRLYNMIEDIIVINDFKLILKFETKPKLFEYSLAQRYSSIYKDTGEEYLLGTGPYSISKFDESKIEVTYNAFYRGSQPEIHHITFTSDVEEVMKSNEEYQTKRVLTHFGDEFVLFNPSKNYSKAQRTFLSDMLLVCISEIVNGNVDIAKPTRQYAPGEIKISKGYVKVLVIDFNKPVYELFREKMKAFGIEVIFYELTNEEYLNSNLLNMDVDFVWMFESYNQHQPFKTLDLLTHCKFQEWYGDFEDARRITNQADYRPNESLKSLCNSFLRKIELMKYMVPIFVHEKSIELPITMKNIKEQPYGTIDFRMIINDNEQ
ncbi:ABC transporter substrate-binding protein [Macrococcus armenti]|uniref:ABC transporter substrate-binding protein n=1 Tax=Macrococcus armenti TaxID=2875764 RepID=UPI001CCDC302|nr:ABC transporter substrate-binding protein [Macrococcus armenti]UBH08503.1 ABC transporter substrate-binding protein [Macrococcus armenti]UBH10789.1 ABC transporter substrate-binding protein [Macrococcus armenti]